MFRRKLVHKNVSTGCPQGNSRVSILRIHPCMKKMCRTSYVVCAHAHGATSQLSARSNTDHALENKTSGKRNACVSTTVDTLTKFHSKRGTSNIFNFFFQTSKSCALKEIRNQVPSNWAWTTDKFHTGAHAQKPHKPSTEHHVCYKLRSLSLSPRPHPVIDPQASVNLYSTRSMFGTFREACWRRFRRCVPAQTNGRCVAGDDATRMALCRDAAPDASRVKQA